MDEVIYGVIFNAKMDIFRKEPPVIALKKPMPSADWLCHHSLKNFSVDTRSRKLTSDPDDNQHEKSK